MLGAIEANTQTYHLRRTIMTHLINEYLNAHDFQTVETLKSQHARLCVIASANDARLCIPAQPRQSRLCAFAGPKK